MNALSVKQYSIINIHDSIFSEFLQIALCTLRLTDFVPKASQLYTMMITEDRNKTSILHQIKKALQDTLKHFPSTERHTTN